MYQENSRKTFVAAGPVGPGCLVKLVAAGVEACDAGDTPLGMTETGATIAGDNLGVRLMNTPGTMEVISGAVIAAGSLLTTGVDGAVIPHTANSPVVGMALMGVVSGSVVEMMPLLIVIPVPSA